MSSPKEGVTVILPVSLFKNGFVHKVGAIRNTSLLLERERKGVSIEGLQ